MTPMSEKVRVTATSTAAMRPRYRCRKTTTGVRRKVSRAASARGTRIACPK
jgi:hypothetical protein